MDFIDQVKLLSDQLLKLKDQIQTEEATKTAFVMPFMQALGYNVFNPMEVCPEFTADVPGLKGEKVDYAIFIDGKPAILFECKWCGGALGHPKHGSQLYRYLSCTEAKFGVLTNGILYRFYTDLEKPNTMDSKPFFEFNLLDIQEATVTELKRFSKSAFNPDELKSAASDLMYTKEVKRIMTEQLAMPTPEFVKFFISQVYSGRATQGVIEKFTEITKHSLHQFISERVTDRLKSAIDAENSPMLTVTAEANSQPELETEEKIVTTEEELQGLYIVKAIVGEVVEPQRIQYKDTQSYFGICLDGKPSKTLCRLWFNTKQKYVGLLDEKNKETKRPIADLNDLYSLTSELRAVATRLTSQPAAPVQTAPEQTQA